MYGEICQFDTAGWSEIEPPPLSSKSCSKLQKATKQIMQVFLRIPQLAHYVRLVRNGTYNMIAPFEVIQLAKDLYNKSLDDLETHAFAHHIRLVPNPDVASKIIPEYYVYDSFHVCEILVKYWWSRVMILGLVQTLCFHLDKVLFPQSYFDMDKVYSEDIRAARQIAMSVDYANGFAPLGTLAITAPLQMSFGTWHRFVLRNHFSPGLTYDYAMAMKKYAYKRSNQMLAVWKSNGASIAQWERFMDAMMGGPPKSSIHYNKISLDEEKTMDFSHLQHNRNGKIDEK
jgi:hypothetical protein